MAKKFSYKALDQQSGDTVRGEILSNNESELEQILRESDLVLISAKEITISRLSLRMLNSITQKDLISFFVHLSQLEKAGVPLLESVEDLKEYSSNQKIRDISQDIYESIKNGSLFSEAMLRHKKIFNRVMISLVSMGEKTGNLASAFQNIYENLKWSLDIKRKTLKAIRYPLFSLFIMLIVAGIMLQIVVPKVTGFILDIGIEIPIYTSALITTSKFFQTNFLYIAGFPVVLFIFLKFLGLSSKTGRRIDALKLRIPLFGDIIQKIEISRFTKIFGVTFTSGVPVLECLDVAKDIIQNKAIKFEINKIKKLVSDGKSVSDSMAVSSYFPSLVVRMFKVGEESGDLSESIKNIEYFYDAEINDAMDKIIGSLQPILIIVMGGLMGWVVTAVFGPIYGNFQNIGV
jgi:type IV pilus assembly protein PilC